MIGAIILAAGKGTRLKCKKANKVTLSFLGKPMIVYGADLFSKIASPVVVVVGAFSQSVKDALKDYDVLYAYQRKRLGTAHATKTALPLLATYSPDQVFVGYGDHLMFYKKKTLKKLANLHRKQKSAVSLVTTDYPFPNKLAWGRIIRDAQDDIVDVIEQKDASPKQLRIKEINPGFYCFDYAFLRDNINKIKKSPVSGEYYLTDMVKVAVLSGKRVIGLKVGFAEVGIGINRPDELEHSQKIYKKVKTSKF